MPSLVRPHFAWHLRTRSLELGSRTLLMGILNLTPDSFSDGGRWTDPAAALQHALHLLDQGADILDLGGESTRPNAIPVSPAEEQDRVLPVLRAILAARPRAILSIDTYHAGTASLAIEAGAEIVNDVSGHLWDRQMSAACATLRCGAILMHTRGRPDEWRIQPPLDLSKVVPLVLDELAARASQAIAEGISRDSIVLDPGFGFGKMLDENFPLLAQFHRLHTLGFPLVAGLSRKGFLRHLLAGAGDSERASGALLEATTAANTAAILSGAHILRVHDIHAARSAAAFADKILASREN